MIDEVVFEVAAGNGGAGLVSFRREKFVPHGGPDGGDGGKGGNVVLVADRMVSGLGRYRDGRPRVAENGQPGGPVQRRGASGGDLELPVPVGCVVWDLDEESEEDADGAPLADLSEHGASMVVARGGRGGWGNKRFATATRRTPRFAQRGANGERRRLRLELKLLADVGLVGLPNAGKSTLLGTWSRARPKVAAYPFTTLEPELGVVELGLDGFVAADMPGLIEGASQGVGLGHEFLRHIERTQVLVHVLDMTRDDPLADRALIDGELRAFGHGLAEKPQILALNKVDDPDGRAHAELLREEFARLGLPYVEISAATGEGTEKLAQLALAALQEARAREAAVEEPPPVLTPRGRPAERFTVERLPRGRVQVRGRTPEWLAATLDVDDEEARQELLDRLKRLGVGRGLARAGVGTGDRVLVGEVEIEWE